MKKKTGTREWSEVSKNCCTGCAHGCIYCYARASAIRWGKLHPTKAAQWTREIERDVKITRHRGVVMFPTEHDITPGNADRCLEVLQALVYAGCRVLVVSKPHFEVMDRIFCWFRDEHPELRRQVRFRYTIGAMDDAILKAWEPGAPTFEERLTCLRMAQKMGFETSVSCEPLLDPNHAGRLVDAVAPYVTDQSPNGGIWIGKLNKARARCAWHLKDHPEFEPVLAALEAQQTDACCAKVHDYLTGIHRDGYGVSLLRWKDSYREALARSGVEV